MQLLAKHPVAAVAVAALLLAAAWLVAASLQTEAFDATEPGVYDQLASTRAPDWARRRMWRRRRAGWSWFW
jgi:putative intracellular protease/amidase